MTEEKTEAKSQVYLATDIMAILQVGRSKAYDFLEKAYAEQQPFRVIKIGKCVRVPKDSFDAWFYGGKEKKDEQR